MILGRASFRSLGHWKISACTEEPLSLEKTQTSCLATGTLYTCPLSFLKPTHLEFVCPIWEKNMRNLSKCNLIGQGNGSEFPRNRFGTRINHISNPSREGWSHVGCEQTSAITRTPMNQWFLAVLHVVARDVGNDLDFTPFSWHACPTF